AVDRDDVDPVPGARGERAEQERGLDLRLEARGVAEAGGGEPGGVDDDEHPSVALGPPRADDDVVAPGGRAPVDRPDVVADDVLAQRVELRALAADLGGRAAVEL